MDKLNQWLTLIANLGVLVGIVFLAIEINQNTAALKIGAMQDVSRAATELSLDTVHSDHLPEIIVKDLAGQQLAPEEAYRLELYHFATMRNFETYYFQWQAGFIDEDLFRSRQFAFRGLLQQKSARSWWEEYKHSFAASFRAHVESEVIEP